MEPISTRAGSEMDSLRSNMNIDMVSETSKKDNGQISANKHEESKQEESGAKDQEQRLIKLIEDANGKIQDDQNEFQFSVHEKTKQILIKVVDRDTKEVIKEFPPEKILDMIAKMCEVAGIFVDEKR